MKRPEKVKSMLAERNGGTGIRPSNRRSHSRHLLSRRQKGCVIALLVLFMLSSIGYVWSTFENTQVGYELSELKTMELRLLEANRKLRAELAFLKSPANLEELATQKLGLKQPSPQQIVVIP